MQKLSQTVFLLTTMLMISSFFSCAQNKKVSSEEEKSDLYFSYGTEKLVEKDYPGALKFLLKAWEYNPKSPQVANNLGLAYFILGDTDSALKFTQISLKLNPKDSDAKNNLASIYFSQGKMEEAKKLYQELLSDLTYARHFRTHYNLGMIELRKGKKQLALNNLKKSLELNSDFCPAHFELGMLFKNNRLLKKANEQFSNGIKGVCYNEPASHFELALTEIELKKIDSAYDRLSNITQRFKGHPYAQLAQEKINEIEKNGYKPIEINKQ
jgi:Tfp pilus assembly protein PilF